MNKQAYRLIVLLGVFSLSLSSILAKASTAPSVVLSLYRVAFALAMLFPFAWKKREELKHLTVKALLLYLGNGAIFGLHFYLYCEAVKYTSIASAAILVDSEILFVAPAMHFFLREKIAWAGFRGIALTLAGSLLIIITSLGQGSHMIYGNLLAISGAFCLACSTISSRKTRSHVSNTTYTFLSSIGSMIFLAAAALFTDTPLTGYEPANYLIALALSIFCTFGGHAVFSWALKYVEAPFISTVKLLEPVLASLMAFGLFGQLPALSTAPGMILVILGLVIYVKGGNTEHGNKSEISETQTDYHSASKFRHLS